MPDNSVVVVATDTDVLILLVYAYHELGPADNGVLKIGWEKFAYVNNVCVHFKHDICQVITVSCHTALFLFRVEKVRPL